MNILVVAAHPDDEILGCGATLARHAAAGDKVHILILAEGVTSRDQKRNAKARGKAIGGLAAAARQAGKIVGAASVTLHDFPDNRMDSVDLLDVIKVVESHIERRRPQTVYTHHAGDLNVDHQITHQAVATACRPVPGHCVRKLLFFEVASSTEWQTAGAQPFFPNWFVDAGKTIDIKLKAMAAYESELRQWPHPRSLKGIEALARWRGATAGLQAAEAFMVGRAVT